MRQGFVGFVLLAGGLVTPSPALPEPLSDSEKIERLQQQTELLQKQLKALQEEVRQAKRRAEAGQAKKAEASVYRWQTSTAETSAVDPPAAETYTADPLPPHRRQVRLEPPPPVVSPGQDGTPGILQAGKTEAATVGRVEFPDGRPTIVSADGRMSLAVGEQLQFDIGGYFQRKHRGVFEPPGARELNDGENLRRGRIYFVGKFGDWTANITPDFGDNPDGVPTLFEANINYTINPITATIGYFKPYDTLARSQFPGDALFMERPSIAFIASNVADGIQRASAGLKAATEDYFIASYLTGALYGSQVPVLLNRQQTGGTLRVATRPFRGEDWNLHIGFSGSTVFNFNKSNFQPGGTVESIRLSDQPELRIDFNRLIDTGLIPANTADTWGYELAANWQNFLIQGEYIRIGVNPTVGQGLNFSGWYVEGSWLLTGESRPYIASSATYGRPTPEHPFELSPGGGWGAWELAGRYSFTDLNSGFVHGGKQEVASAALSWYPNAHVRFILQGSHVNVNRFDLTDTIQVGQSFWDLGLRSQVIY